jgi:aldehyde:ferredoxin oxidoreductase
MLPEYYELRGWTPEGVPTEDTLARLGLSAGSGGGD